MKKIIEKQHDEGTDQFLTAAKKVLSTYSQERKQQLAESFQELGEGLKESQRDKKLKNTTIANKIVFDDNAKGPSGSSVSYYHFKTKGAYAFYFLKENNFCYNLNCTPQESNVIRFVR